MNGRVTVHGIQGHVAYPHKARNPIHELNAALSELAERTWDNGASTFHLQAFRFPI